jgi:hypothetical protein
MMGEEKQQVPSDIRLYLKIQIAVSCIFALGAFAFPIFILYKHGLGVLPVYDGGGNVIGHASYFLLSLALSAFALLLCFLAYWRQRKF